MKYFISKIYGLAWLFLIIGGLTMSSSILSKPQAIPLVEILKKSEFVAVVTVVSGAKSSAGYTYSFTLKERVRGRASATEICTQLPLAIGRDYLIFPLPKAERERLRYGQKEHFPAVCRNGQIELMGFSPREILEFDAIAEAETEAQWLKLPYRIYTLPDSAGYFLAVTQLSDKAGKQNEALRDAYELVKWSDIKPMIYPAP